MLTRAYRESSISRWMPWAREATHQIQFLFQWMDNFCTYPRITSSKRRAHTANRAPRTRVLQQRDKDSNKTTTKNKTIHELHLPTVTQHTVFDYLSSIPILNSNNVTSTAFSTTW